MQWSEAKAHIGAQVVYEHTDERFIGKIVGCTDSLVRIKFSTMEPEQLCHPATLTFVAEQPIAS